jgi:hypothetical protein
MRKSVKLAIFPPYNGNLPIDKGLPTRLRQSGNQTVSHSLRNSFIGSRIFPHEGFYRHLQLSNTLQW